MLTYLVVLLIAIAGGVTQCVTGFGSGVVMIAVLPYFFPVTEAAAVNTSICMFLTVTLAWKFRREINWRLVLPLYIPYQLMSLVVISFASGIPTKTIGIAFGCFLTALAIYFMCFSEKVHLKASLPVLILCGLFSGIFSGLFGVGGPLLALCLLESTRSKTEYLACTQSIFAFGNVINTLTRCLNGLYTVSLLPATVFGAAGILIGKKLGLFASGKLKPEYFKKVVYVFVGVSGIIALIKYIRM